MGSHVTFTPKISKLDVHLEYIRCHYLATFPSKCVYSVVFFKV